MRIPEMSKRRWQILAFLTVAITGTLAAGFFAGSMFAKSQYDKQSAKRLGVVTQCLKNNEQLQDKIPPSQ